MDKKDSDKIWDLCVKKVHHSLDVEEKEEFERIGDSEEVRQALRQVKRIYRRSSGSFLIQRIDRKKEWKKINRQISSGFRIRRFAINCTKYAAVFLAALLVGLAVPKSFHLKSQEAVNNKIEMGWGQMGKITLSDGTHVWLNSGTTLAYPTAFGNGKRLVALEGEAQFMVTHRDKIPFEVKTGSGIIQVYGTTFNVSAYPDDPELTVTLIEGKVTVENSNGDHLVTLDPSEQLCLNKISGKATLKKVNTDFYSNWIDGKILLDNTRLSELTQKLERWYNVDIQLQGDHVGDIRISGTISKGKPLDLFMKILERMYGVQYQLITNNDKKDEVIIYKN